jgi:SAM-dependent methyltransferase
MCPVNRAIAISSSQIVVWQTDPQGIIDGGMPILSEIARRKKCEHFLVGIPKTARILEVGCAGGWVGDYLRKGGWKNYIGMDIEHPAAEIVGDIKNWRGLGLQAESIDVIIAFEVIEHVDLVSACFDFLKPGGLLMLTSPVPHFDWIMKTLEAFGLNQKRTSPHCNLVYLDKLPPFETQDYRRVGGLSQWGILRKPQPRVAVR